MPAQIAMKTHLRRPPAACRGHPHLPAPFAALPAREDREEAAKKASPATTAPACFDSTRTRPGKAMWRCAIAVVCTLLVPTGNAKAYKAYVSNEKSNTISVIDTAERKVIGTIKVGQRPRGIAITRDQKYVLVAVGDDDTIQMIDTASNRVVDTLPSGPDPELFADDPAGRLLYVANENDNTVTIIDIERRARLADVEVGVEPEGMGLSPTSTSA